MEAKAATIVLLLLLLTLGGEAGSRICHDHSQTFRGICVQPTNCIACCTNEDYTGGYCTTVTRRCMCTKPCGGDSPPDDPPARA
ncbi:defensin NsD7-like [Oryza brachyantha]|uniref:defensin NsD7-like n=1 Tax=Oryza brachyantha TaxID=4533 RepID=UPI000776612B|nr:defensin NsD7-like [Oryza brachyantha]